MPAAMSASNDSLEPRKPQSEEGFSPFATDRAEGPSIDPADVARFSAQAAEWWAPNGPFAPLHRFNPARLKFVRDRAAEHYGRDVRARAPFAGLSLIDIGCGGKKKEGFIGLDQYLMPGVDHVLDIGTERWPFADGSVDEAYSSNFLEHLTNLGALPPLRRATRALMAAWHMAETGWRTVVRGGSVKAMSGESS